MKCEDCGKEKDDVSERYDPYESEINDKEVLVTICDDCDEERYMEI